MEGRDTFLFLLLALSSYYFIYPCYSETDTLQQGQQLKDWDELISANKVFNLKFFGFGTTTISPYLGIFYDYHEASRCYGCDDLYYFRDTAIWVANRNDPITDVYGKLMIDVYGTLSILSGGSTVLDLFSPTPLVRRKTSATLLDSGNFVLRELYPDGSVKQVLWQSFDYPTDTLLPGMRLGINLRTGHRWSLVSWRSTQLPTHGSFTLTGDPNGTGQLVILRQGSIHWKSGPWQNGQFINTDLQSSGPDVHLYYVSNETEQSFTYLAKTYYSGPILRMYPNGHLKSSNLKFDVQCSSVNDPGCAEDEFENIECRKDYHFRKVSGYIYRDKYEYEESYNLTIYDCKRICWSNCSCVAYTYANKNKAGCKTFGQMIYNPSENEPEDSEYYAFVLSDSDEALRRPYPLGPHDTG